MPGLQALVSSISKPAESKPTLPPHGCRADTELSCITPTVLPASPGSIARCGSPRVRRRKEPLPAARRPAEPGLGNVPVPKASLGKEPEDTALPPTRHAHTGLRLVAVTATALPLAISCSLTRVPGALP